MEGSTREEPSTVETISPTDEPPMVGGSGKKSKEPPTAREVEEPGKKTKEPLTVRGSGRRDGASASSISQPASGNTGQDEPGERSTEEQMPRRRRSGSSTGSISSEVSEETRRKRKVSFRVHSHLSSGMDVS